LASPDFKVSHGDLIHGCKKKEEGTKLAQKNCTSNTVTYNLCSTQFLNFLKN
jgi:hypothetical protein